MEDETPLDETSEIKEPEETQPDPKNVATHPAVLAVRGNACTVEGCDFVFGDPVHGIEPHPLTIITIKAPKNIGPTPPEPPPRVASAAKCAPVQILDTCGECGWSAANSHRAASGEGMKNQGTVSIGYCYGHQEQEFIDSLRDLQIFDRAHNGLVQHVHPSQGLYIAQNRNNVVKQFIETKNDWLIFLDCDIDFRPEMIYALYEVADPVTRPIVSGVYFSRLAQSRLCPVWFMERDNGKYSTVECVEGDEGQPQAIDAFGTGFCIIHRKVFAKLSEIHGKDEWTWFGHDETFNAEDGKMHHLGEDLTFCRRARRAGFPIYGHAGIQVGHIKKVALSYELWLAEEHPEQHKKYKFERGCVVGPADPIEQQVNGAMKVINGTRLGDDAMP